jgi:hypothetical protein
MFMRNEVSSSPEIGFNLTVATNEADCQLVKSKIHECRRLRLGEPLEQYDIKYVQKTVFATRNLIHAV